MVGQGVLRECLLAEDVEQVLAIGRTPTGVRHAKLRETGLNSFAEEVAGYDACFFCLGVSSAGMSEADYRRITYDLTLEAARVLAGASPGITFIYVSGAGTGGKSMWARVKGKAEDDLIAMESIHAVAFRPGLIQPKYGARSKTGWVRAAYVVMGPLLGGLRRVFPRQITTTEQIGRAMLNVARGRDSKRVYESPDIVAAGSGEKNT